MIGMILGEQSLSLRTRCVTCPDHDTLAGDLYLGHCTSVRARVRDEVDGYSASSDYWLRFLYEGEDGNPDDVEKGFLKSEILIKVCFYSILPFTLS